MPVSLQPLAACLQARGLTDLHLRWAFPMLKFPHWLCSDGFSAVAVGRKHFLCVFTSTYIEMSGKTPSQESCLNHPKSSCALPEREGKEMFKSHWPVLPDVPGFSFGRPSKEKSSLCALCWPMSLLAAHAALLAVTLQLAVCPASLCVDGGYFSKPGEREVVHSSALEQRYSPEDTA